MAVWEEELQIPVTMYPNGSGGFEDKEVKAHSFLFVGVRACVHACGCLDVDFRFKRLRSISL